MELVCVMNNKHVSTDYGYTKQRNCSIVDTIGTGLSVPIGTGHSVLITEVHLIQSVLIIERCPLYTVMGITEVNT